MIKNIGNLTEHYTVKMTIIWYYQRPYSTALKDGIQYITCSSEVVNYLGTEQSKYFYIVRIFTLSVAGDLERSNV